MAAILSPPQCVNDSFSGNYPLNQPVGLISHRPWEHGVTVVMGSTKTGFPQRSIFISLKRKCSFDVSVCFMHFYHCWPDEIYQTVGDIPHYKMSILENFNSLKMLAAFAKMLKRKNMIQKRQKNAETHLVTLVFLFLGQGFMIAAGNFSTSNQVAQHISSRKGGKCSLP